MEEITKYLLDKTADLASRDDCALDLGAVDDPVAEKALIQVATDFTEDEDLIDSAGESLWEIWRRMGKEPPEDVISKMHPSARKFFRRDDV